MYNRRDNWHWMKIFFILCIRILLMSIVGYLSLNCSQGSNIVLRIFFLFFSVAFSELYIIYYTIYRICMGNSCPAIY